MPVLILIMMQCMSFPGGSADKKSCLKCREPQFQFPGLEDPGEWMSCPLQYSWTSWWLRQWTIYLLCERPGFQSWSWEEDSQRRGRYSCRRRILLGQRSLVEPQSMGLQEIRHDAEQQYAGCATRLSTRDIRWVQDKSRSKRRMKKMCKGEQQSKRRDQNSYTNIRQIDVETIQSKGGRKHEICFRRMWLSPWWVAKSERASVYQFLPLHYCPSVSVGLEARIS